MNASAGIQKLIRLLGEHPEAEIAGELAGVSPEVWPDLLRLAAKHEVAPLLSARVRRLDLLSLLPVESQAALMWLYGASALRNRRLLLESEAVLDALRGAGIPVIVLKGVHLASEVYGDVALRQMHDIDLLVPPDLQRKAESVLRGIGYLGTNEGTSDGRPPYHHLAPMEKSGCAPIDLHHALTQSFGGLRIDLGGLWQRARSIRIRAASALCLSPEDLLIHLALHVSHGHGFQVPIRSVYDIAAVLDRHRDSLNWTQVAALANREGSSRYVYSTLRLVDRLFSPPMPHGELERLNHGEADREVVELASCFIEAGAPPLPLVYRNLVDGTTWGERFGVLRRRLFSERARRAALAELLSRSGRMALDLVESVPHLRRAWQREGQRRRIRRWQRETRPE